MLSVDSPFGILGKSLLIAALSEVHPKCWTLSKEAKPFQLSANCWHSGIYNNIRFCKCVQQSEIEEKKVENWLKKITENSQSRKKNIVFKMISLTWIIFVSCAVTGKSHLNQFIFLNGIFLINNSNFLYIWKILAKLKQNVRNFFTEIDNLLKKKFLIDVQGWYYNYCTVAKKNLYRYHSAKSDNWSFHTEKSQLKKSAKNNFFVIIILLKYLALCNKNHKCWSPLWELATLHLFWSVLLQVIGSLENPFV